MPAEGLALTPAASGASCSRTPMWCCEFPSLLGFCHAPVGSQPFIRRSPHMMGFGHVPTGSIRNNGHTGVGGPRRSPSTASVRGRDSGGGLEASDLPVAHRVKDEGQELAGQRDAGLVLAGVFGDALVVGAQLLVALGPVVAHGLDGRPADQR